MRGKQMEAQKRPLLLAIATQRQKGKRGGSKWRPEAKANKNKNGTFLRGNVTFSLPNLQCFFNNLH